MMKKLLILGAGIYQVPLIKKAKQMGLYTIVASYRGAYPGLAYADEAWEVDTRDSKELLACAREARIDGALTAGTDVAVRSLGVICEALGLPGISEQSAKVVTDKALMKEAFVKGQVATPMAYKVTSLDEAVKAFASIGGLALIKAVDSSGSRGITKVEKVEDIKAAWASARKVSKTDYLLVEEFVDAHEIGVDGFISDGEIKFMLPHDKFTHTVDNVTIPAGHMFPFDCSAELEAEILRQMQLAVDATGLNNCAVNADVLVTGDKAYILEIGGRSGATCIPELISIYGDFDYYKAMIMNALGEPPKLAFGKSTACMGKLLFADKGGTITTIDEVQIDELRLSGADISLDYSIGAKVEAVRDGTSRIGQVIMQTSDVKVLDEILFKVRGAISIDEKN